MSALLVEPLKKGRRHGFCLNRCEGFNGIRAGTHRASIAGYPLGVLCGQCAKEWARLWQSALDGGEAVGEGSEAGRTTPVLEEVSVQAPPEPSAERRGTKHARGPRQRRRARLLA